MTTVWNQPQSAIGCLHVHYRGHQEEMSATARRLHMERLLGSIDLHALGLPPGAILVIRQIQHLVPLSARTQFLPADWIEHLHNQIREFYSHAARPILAPVAATAQSVIFADSAEMLACFTRDVLNGQVWQYWYWQQIVRNISHRPGSALTTLWGRQAIFLPAALSVLKADEMYTAISLLSLAEINTITHALHSSFALPSVVSNAASLPVSSSGFASAQGDDFIAHDHSTSVQPMMESEEKHSIPIVAPPWQRILPASSAPSTLLPQARYLLGVALTLYHAPSFARSRRFALQATSWLNRELAILQLRKSSIAELSSYQQSRGSTLSPSSDDDHSTHPPLIQQPQTEATTATEHTESTKQLFPIEEPERQPAQPETSVSTVHDEVVREVPELLTQHLTPPTEESATAHDTLTAKPASLADGIITGLGGILYLINVLIWLNLPGCWDEDESQAELIDSWSVVEILARGLLSAAYGQGDDDPIWKVLAQLSGRDTLSPADIALPQWEAFRLPASWLRRYAPAQLMWQAQVQHDHLLLFDKTDGYLIVDTPLSGRSLTAVVAEEVENYRAQGIANIMWESVAGEPWEFASLPTQQEFGPTVAWWLQRVLGFIRYLLARALGDAALTMKQVVDILFFKQAQLFISHTHVDLHMSMEQISLPIRRSGLDRDPDWVPDLGYIVLFHFDKEMLSCKTFLLTRF